MSQFYHQSFPFVAPVPMVQMPGGPQREAPARIRVMLELLGHLTCKTSPRAVCNELSIEIIPGQALTKAERNLQETACNALNDYFLGKIEQDSWEKEELESESAKNVSVIVRCPSCIPGPPNPTCLLCHGVGQVAVRPAVNPD